MKARTRKGAVAVAGAAALACSALSVKAAPTFTDNYSTDTTANYTQTNDPGAPATLTETWAVGGGTLNYTRHNTVAGADAWATSVFLTKPTIASTAGMSSFTVEGDALGNTSFHLNPTDSTSNNFHYFQPGLVLSGDTVKGGYVVELFENGGTPHPAQWHWVLLRENGGQLSGDEGGTTTPPLLADFGNYQNFITDNFHVSGTVDKTGPHPALTVTVTDTTAGFSSTRSFIDTGVASSFGGSSIGWRTRYHLDNAALSFDNLTLEAAVPEPATAGMLVLGAVGLLAARSRRRQT